MKEKTNFRVTSQITGEKSRWTISLALGLAICLSVISSGCASSAEITCGGGADAGDVDELIDGFELRNARFRIPAVEAGLLPTDNFWFSKHDTLAAKTIFYGWDESFIQFREADVSGCNYAAPGSGCRQCDFCADASAPCTDGTSGELATVVNQYAALFEASDQNSGEQMLREFIRPIDGCLLRTGNPTLPSFVAGKDATYTLRKTFFCGDTKDLVALQTTELSTARIKTEEMIPYTETVSPKVRFTFQMPLLMNGKLRENFSPNIKVTKVRILLGTKDPNTGLTMTKNSDLDKIRPSRILFLSAFVNGNIYSSRDATINHCYANTTVPDGDFNLQICRRDVSPTSQSVRFDATPTFLHTNISETLTWVLDYEPQETPDGPILISPFGEGEFPVLEFTIE